MSPTPWVLAVVRDSSAFGTLAHELSELKVDVSFSRDAEAGPKFPPPDVILCDADGYNWVEALDRFHSQFPTTPVVFLIRLADEHLWAQMLQAGAYDLLEKPYVSRDLRWIVSGALHRHRAMAASAVA